MKPGEASRKASTKRTVRPCIGATPRRVTSFAIEFLSQLDFLTVFPLLQMFLALLCLSLAHPVARVCLRDGGHLNPLSSPSVYSLCLLPLLFGWVHLGAISLDRLFWIHNNMRYGLAIFLCCSLAIKIFTVVGYLICEKRDDFPLIVKFLLPLHYQL